MLLSHSAVRREYELLKEKALEYSRGLRDMFLIATVFVNLAFLFLVGIIRCKVGEGAAPSFLTIVILWTLLNLLFLFLKKSSVSEVGLNSRSELKKALKGSAGVFISALFMFGVVLFFSVVPICEDAYFNVYFSLSGIIVSIGLMLSAILFSSIIDIGTALLWKISVSEGNSSLVKNFPISS